jgi:Methylamine utilisation protein MauE.
MLRFEAQLSEYRLLPEGLVAPAAKALACVEAVLAVALVLPVTRELAAVAAGMLLALYAAAIGVNLLRGRDHIDCGCGDAPTLLSPWLLLRNGALVLVAAVVALPEAARATGLLDWAFGALGLLALVMLWAIVELLLANASALREWSQARD